MLSIQTNVNSMNAQENLRLTNLFQGRTISRLTSGYRINESGDDAAGLAVANKYRSDVAELQQGVRNANDGLSTMQIIDGGLNNISKMLDRLKTLATQSASQTFSGNRATLNQEYQSLLTEIDRQAANVGLGNGGGSASRYNRELNVYIGGGGDLNTNSGIMVDLSSASDKVNGGSLGIAGTNVNGGFVITATNSHTDLGADKILAGNQTQTVTVNVNGEQKVVTLKGGADGITAFDAVAKINNEIASLDISAVINSTTGELQFVSSKAFSVQIAAASGTASDGLVSAAGNTVNSALYRVDGNVDPYINLAGTDEDVFTVTTEAGDSKTITLDATNGGTIQDAIDTLNSELNSMGVYATRNAAGTGISLMSASDFDVDTSAADTAAANGMFTDAAVTTTAADETVQNDTGAAEAAIAAVTNAVSRLGVVQGKIGTAQNKLSYAIQLAQSQVTSFSAAESRIRDADVASEAANLTKAQVLQQASLAALAQANSAPQAVLSLLRG